ncbi:MAG: transcription antitermination factor NusB [bacterium]|nr:transcription antitermination factor NusB [bacterium]
MEKSKEKETPGSKVTFVQGRRQARENALQILYMMDVMKYTPGEALEIFNEQFSEVSDKSIESYTRDLVYGTTEHLTDIDELIESYAKNWVIKRMAIVDRNILRFAVFELVYREDIPRKVSINEAIEVAKKYGNTDSNKFVNGILDKITVEKKGASH